MWGLGKRAPRSLAVIACGVLAACTTSGRQPSVTEADTPAFDTPAAVTAANPQVVNLGNTGLWITSAQSEIMRDLLFAAEPVAEDCATLPPQQRRECENRKAVEAQIKRYGEFYRRLTVDLGDGNWNPTAGPDGVKKGRLEFDCARPGNGALANFLGNILGFKRGRTAALTVTVAATAAAVNDDDASNDFVSNYPLLFVSRNQERRGVCEYLLNDTPLTPFISPWPQDSLYLKAKVHWTDAREVNLDAAIGLVSSIGALATPSKGFTKTIGEISSAGLTGSINAFLARWNRDVTGSRAFEVRLNTDRQKPYDKIVLSLNRPEGEGEFGTLRFPQGPAITLRFEYAPTMFSFCGGELDLNQCRLSEPDVILGQVYSTTPPSRSLKEIADSVPISGEGARSLTLRLKQTEEKPVDVARADIGGVCRDAKQSTNFAPYGAMNKLDRLVFLYTWLTAFRPDFDENRRLHPADQCFSSAEEGLLKSFDDRFVFPGQTAADLGRAFRDALSQQLQSGAVGKRAAFHSSGQLEIGFAKLVEGIERVTAPRGEEAAAVLEDIKFKAGSLACFMPGLDPSNLRPTDRIFGFAYKLDDNAEGGRKGFYAPFVVELASDAEPVNGQVRLKSMFIPATTAAYFEKLNYAGVPSNPWADCPVTPENKPALDEMRSDLGVN